MSEAPAHPARPAPRRILMTADTVGGVWTYALELAYGLTRVGACVDLAAMGGPLSDAQRAEADSIPNLTVHESDFRLEWMDDPWVDVARAGEWLLDLESEIRPDLIHLNGFAHGALPFRAPVLVVGHSCVFSWHEAVHGRPPERAAWARYHRAVQNGLRGADAVTAPTGVMLQALRKHYGRFEAAPCVYNGVRTDNFRPRKKQAYVLAAGRVWDEAKNVAAVARLADRNPWKVRVAGEACHPDGGTMETDAAVFLGRLDRADLARHYGHASIFCHPARYEPFGLAPLEAAHSGCALALGNIPTLREVWGDAALFVDPDDDTTLEAVVRGLIANEVLRRRMMGKASRRARYFTVERMTRGYLSIYERLLARGTAPSQASDRLNHLVAGA